MGLIWLSSSVGSICPLSDKDEEVSCRAIWYDSYGRTCSGRGVRKTLLKD